MFVGYFSLFSRTKGNYLANIVFVNKMMDDRGLCLAKVILEGGIGNGGEWGMGAISRMTSKHRRRNRGAVPHLHFCKFRVECPFGACSVALFCQP